MDLHLLLNVRSLCFEAVTEQLAVLHGNIWPALFCSTSQAHKIISGLWAGLVYAHWELASGPYINTAEINIKQHVESPQYQTHIQSAISVFQFICNILKA